MSVAMDIRWRKIVNDPRGPIICRTTLMAFQEWQEVKEQRRAALRQLAITCIVQACRTASPQSFFTSMLGMYTKELRGLCREKEIMNYTGEALQINPGLRVAFLEEARAAREGWFSDDKKMNSAIARWQETTDELSLLPTAEASI